MFFSTTADEFTDHGLALENKTIVSVHIDQSKPKQTVG